MIVYFSDRQMQVMGLASTNLPDGFVIIEDLKTEEIETGVATFSCRIGFNDENRLELEGMTNAGNFLLRSHNGENEFYTIIDTEIDTKNKTINVYAEDAGLDLINEIAGEFEATESHTIDWYVNKYIAGSGFEIGINEEKTALRKLKWEGEETVTSRLASIATQFGGFEISYSFEIAGLTITKKYVNIHKERGKDAGITLRLNQDIDKIITTKSVANLATAFLCEGGVPDKAEEPITFSSTGYTWKDADNDFYIEGNLLKSKKAIQKWSRQALKLNQGDGVIVRPYSYNTTDPATLRAHAVTELKKVCDMEVNYEVDISVLPESIKIGDRINIVDDGGELYLSTRILVLETSVVDQKHSAVLGEHLIKTSGISQKVADLAEQFAKTSVSAEQALKVANAANTHAEAAQGAANQAAAASEGALAAAEAAQAASETASKSASDATAAAEAAEKAVSDVSGTVSEMEKVVSEAERLAKSAQESATTAASQSVEAKTAAQNAATNAAASEAAATQASASAASAIATASTANTQAEEAKANAQAASDVAAAAKLDSEQAKKDVEAFGESLETFEATMKADYARKTDLTETTATLEAKITANANQISSTLSRVTTIDETANNAKDLAEAAQSAASGAQATASQATAEAEAAQTKANEAKAAAEAAQSNAATAQAAADAAKGVADKAEEDLATAKANLESVTSRVGATEQEIADAQAAVNTAQAAANQAKADAATAAQKATAAQTTADTAVTNASNAQSAANDAASKANAAQATANEAKGNAATAQAAADEAKANAATAQATANTAVTNAATAQAKANQAATEAAAAQKAAEDADAKASAAQTDLNTAKANLEAVKGRVDATEEEIAAAEKAVEDAKKAADDAQAAAEAAQSTADQATADAEAAQAAANEAKTAADNAQQAADEAKEAADKAQADVDALVVRVEANETAIEQSNKEIALRATRVEVDAIVVGGRNLIIRSTEEAGKYIGTDGSVTSASACSICDYINIEPNTDYMFTKTTGVADNYFRYAWYDADQTYIGREPNDSNEFKWTSPSNAHYIRISYPTDCQVKFEKGNKATDWEPAPEDIDSKFLKYKTWEETESELSVRSENITSTVTQSAKDEVVKLETKAMTKIQQLADNLSMLVKGEDGSTLMEQTEDGWTFNFGKTTKEIEDIKNALAENAEYIKFTVTDDGNGGTEPCIELGVSQTDATTGEVGEGKYKVLITNTRIIFKEGSATPTYISNETLVSEKVKVTQELHHTNTRVLGSFVWKMRQNGNLGLSWNGVVLETCTISLSVDAYGDIEVDYFIGGIAATITAPANKRTTIEVDCGTPITLTHTGGEHPSFYNSYIGGSASGNHHTSPNEPGSYEWNFDHS